MVHVVKTVQVTSKLSPKNHFITTYFVVQTISSIIDIRYYSAYDMFIRYHHAYQRNKKSAEIVFLNHFSLS